MQKQNQARLLFSLELRHSFSLIYSNVSDQLPKLQMRERMHDDVVTPIFNDFCGQGTAVKIYKR